MFRILIALVLMNAPALAHDQATFGEDFDCTFPEPVRETRPGIEQGVTEIRIGVFLLDLPKIDDADQTFFADVFFRFSWKDPRLAHGRSTPCKVALGTIWHPNVLVVNQRNVKPQLEDVAEIQPDGSVRYVQRFFGTFSEAWNLSRFPFDQQILPVTLVARFPVDELKLLPDDTLIEMAGNISNPNWRISQPVVTSGAYTVHPGQSIARLDVRFPAKRRSGYYVWKLLVPLSFVVFMSWMSFWISPQHIAPRIGLSATSMLTLIAFRLALGSSLPPIPYLTEFDVFTIGGTILVFAALLESVLTTALWDKDRRVLARRVNTWSKIVFPLAFASVVVLSFTRFTPVG
jgi:hypothetical protein